MKKFTWLTTKKNTNTETITPENIIELMKLNGFKFNYTYDNYHYFDRDNMSGFVTSRNDNTDVITMSTKGCKFSVLLPISHIEQFFIGDRKRSDAVNVYVKFLGYEQTFATK